MSKKIFSFIVITIFLILSLIFIFVLFYETPFKIKPFTCKDVTYMSSPMSYYIKDAELVVVHKPNLTRVELGGVVLGILNNKGEFKDGGKRPDEVPIILKLASFHGPENYIEINISVLINCEGKVVNALIPPLQKNQIVYVGEDGSTFWAAENNGTGKPIAVEQAFKKEYVARLSHGIDSDKDGVVDIKDNCPNIPNKDQLDNDADRIGDLCDNCPDAGNSDQGDIDNDGIADACDNCPKHPNHWQEDSDNNSIGDVCEFEIEPFSPTDIFYAVSTTKSVGKYHLRFVSNPYLNTEEIYGQIFKDGGYYDKTKGIETDCLAVGQPNDVEMYEQIITVKTNIGEKKIYLPLMPHGGYVYVAKDGSTYWINKNHGADKYFNDLFNPTGLMSCPEVLKPEHLARASG